MLWGMKKFTLTEAQTNELRRAHRSATNKRDADRIKAVCLLSLGKSPREIAEVLMLDEDTIGNYRKRYEAGGIAGLLKDVYTQRAYGWVKRGQDKLVKSNSGRQRININGALNAETLEVVIRTDDRINAQSTLKLFETLEKKHPNADSIFITLDNARYYKNKLVSVYLETSKIKLLFLPSYSPNLNLIERLWKFMRKTILYNQYYEKFLEFETAIMQFFADIAQYSNKLSTLLTHNFQVIGAP